MQGHLLHTMRGVCLVRFSSAETPDSSPLLPWRSRRGLLLQVVRTLVFLGIQDSTCHRFKLRRSQGECYYSSPCSDPAAISASSAVTRRSLTPPSRWPPGKVPPAVIILTISVNYTPFPLDNSPLNCVRVFQVGGLLKARDVKLFVAGLHSRG